MNRSLVALAVAGALALPALAQNQESSSQPQAQPAAAATSNPAADASSNAATPQSDATQPAAAQADANAQSAGTLQPLTYKKHEGFWGHLNPFARKKYVERQVQPMQSRLNELDELTASNARLLKDVDARATQGIQLASARASLADQHALEAGNRAQLAAQTAQQANTRLQTVTQAVENYDQYQTSSQVELRFRSGERALSKRAKAALDQMATPLKDQKGYIVEVQGFSFARGVSGIQASDALAESVVRYLVLQDEIPVYRIYKVGMGNAPVSEQGKAERLRGSMVEISLLKNSLGDLDQPAGGSGAAAPPAGATTPATGQPEAPAKGESGKPTPEQPQPSVQPQS